MSLSQTLGNLGQRLIDRRGKSRGILSTCIEEYKVTHLYRDLFSGADSRGSRQFNLDKQTQMYDSDEVFINKWQGKAAMRYVEHVDMVDWLIAPLKGDS